MLADKYDIQTGHATHDDFERARRRARRNYVLAAVTGRPRHVEAFAELGEQIVSQVYRGIQQVPVAQIVGSVNRSADFDAGFNPLHKHTRQRWERLSEAMGSETGVPPVELCKVGEHYYVKDGNHRVSVARFHSMEYIDAEVVELRTGTGVPCAPYRPRLAALIELLKALQPHPAFPSLQAHLRHRAVQDAVCGLPL